MRLILDHLKTWVYGIIVAVLSFVLLYIGNVFVLPQLSSQPTIVEALRMHTSLDGSVDIAFMNAVPSGSLTFSENNYLRVGNVTDPTFKRNILMSLRDDSVSGPRYHNHPQTDQSGIMKVTFSDTEWYYVFFKLHTCGEKKFASIDASRKCSSNPNSAKNYENASFYLLLRQMAAKDRHKGEGPALSKAEKGS